MLCTNIHPYGPNVHKPVSGSGKKLEITYSDPKVGLLCDVNEKSSVMRSQVETPTVRWADLM